MTHSKSAHWAAFVLAAILLSCSRATASITVISDWRMGESDSGAVAGASVTTSQDCIGTNALQFQAATYSSDVGNRTFARQASVLSVNLTNSACGTNDHVVSTLTDNFGIEAWVKPTKFTDGIIVYNGNTTNNGWGLVTSAGQYSGLFGNVRFDGRLFLLDSWSHIALIRSNSVAILFINGTPAATNTSVPQVPAGNFGIACAPQLPGTQPFTGLIDEVRVFTFAPGQFNPSDLLYNGTVAPATTLPAREITATGATLNGVIVPAGVATGGWLDWGLTTGYGNSTPATSIGNGTAPLTISNHLAGLQPGTAYHYRLVVTNSGGTLRSWDQTFVTPVLTVTSNLTAYVHAPFTNPPATLSAIPLVLSANDGPNGMVLKSDGTVALWGDNSFNQTNFASTLSNIIGIAAGDFHFLALKRDGTVVAWGKNNFNQTNVPAGLDNVAAVAAGGNISMALRRDGTMTNWGVGAPIPQPWTNLIQLSASLFNAAALTADGKILSSSTPPPDATNLVSIAAGANHYLALRADGKVFAWGSNLSGQTNVPPAATNIIAIAGAGAGSIALRQDGAVFAWGSNDGNKNTVPPSLTNAIAVAAAGGANFALRADGVAFGWGAATSGQTTVSGGLTNITGLISVSGPVNTNAPGLNTLIYTTTNLLGAMNAATVSVSVLYPSLTLIPTNSNSAKLSWPSNALGYTLEQSTNLSGSWAAAPSGMTNPISISTTNSQLFYRLSHP